jgi:predicted  nucleic acid-binding Zn-ribbon protein
VATTDLRFDVTALDQASKAFARMGQAVERFERRLDDLDGKKIRAEGEFDSKKAEREVGQFARKMQRDIEAAVKALPDIEIDADSSDAQREIAHIRGELAAIADQRVGIDIDADEASARVDALRGRLEALGDVDLNVQMTADVGTALAQLAAVDGAVERLDGKRAEVKFVADRSLSDTIVRVAALGRALGQIALPAAVVAVAPQIAGIGAAAVSASGALGQSASRTWPTPSTTHRRRPPKRSQSSPRPRGRRCRRSRLSGRCGTAYNSTCRAACSTT